MKDSAPNIQDSRIPPTSERLGNQKPSIMSVDDVRLEKAAKKVDVIRPIVFLNKRSITDVKQIAEKADVNPRTVYRWIRKYQDFHGPAGLLTPSTFGGKGKGRIGREVEAIFTELFHSRYASSQKLSVAAFYSEFQAACYKHGIRKVPSYHSIYRRIKSQDDKMLTKARHGLEAFNAKYQISGGEFEDGKYPLQTIMIDHTKLDIMLVDEDTGQEIGRPFLTIALDVYSRCVWGYYLGFQPPNADIVGLTIRMGCLKKDNLIDMFHLSEWPVFGIPNQIHTDNGKDFRAKLLERGCLANQISIMHRPVKRPQFGPYIERFFRTLNTKFNHTLPGTTFSNIRQKGKYDSSKNAHLTLKDLEKLLLRFIADQYHNENHNGLGTTPLQKWKEGLEAYGIQPTMPRNVERFRQDFLCFVDPDGKRRIERDGVHFKDLVYYASELEILSKYEQNKKKEYLVRYDPSDLRYLYIYDDERDVYHRLYLRSRPQQPFTIYELEANRRVLKQKGLRQPNEAIVMEAILDRGEYVESRVAASKAMQNRNAGRRRTQELKRRIQAFDEQEKQEEAIEFHPESIDVNSVNIIPLDGAR